MAFSKVKIKDDMEFKLRGFISVCVYHKTSCLLGSYLMFNFTVSLFLNFDEIKAWLHPVWHSLEPFLYPNKKKNLQRLHWILHLTPFVSRVLSIAYWTLCYVCFQGHSTGLDSLLVWFSTFVLTFLSNLLPVPRHRSLQLNVNSLFWRNDIFNSWDSSDNKSNKNSAAMTEIMVSVSVWLPCRFFIE